MEEAHWLRYLIPLPQEISVEDSICLHPGDVSVRVRDGAGELERQAAAELVQLFVDRAGVKPEGQAFTVAIGVADGDTGDVRRLKALPNNEQAYAIRAEGQRLFVSGLGERGVYYGVRTLSQLLEPVISTEQVRMPLAQVVDWPDMDERGLWNFPDPPDWIPWLAEVKLNYGKMASTQLLPVERDKPNDVLIDGATYRAARRRAFNYVPYILHLNFLEDVGLFRAYPTLAGKSDGALTGRYFAHKQGNQHRVPCASNPLLANILCEWMEAIGAQGAEEISCWLSERPGQCGCEACTAEGQFVLEARSFVRAWEKARQEYPDLAIRIFLSTTTCERDHRVLAELPPEVKVERCCATELERVAHLPRDLMTNPLLDHSASAGRWVASYDVPVAANGKVDTPEFKVPQRSAHRIKDYVGQLVRRRYSGAYAMLAWGGPERDICSFNIQALAEWSWNSEGRSEREFAVAWATREGFTDPEALGDWAELMGPVEFDVYDSDFPVCYSWGRAVDMVRQRQRPYLGEGMFRYFVDTGDFERKQEVCARALEMADVFENPDLAHETRLVSSYVELARCIWQVAEQLATADLENLENQQILRQAVSELENAGEENIGAIRTWRDALGPEPWHYRVHDATKATEETVREIARFVCERYFY